MECPKSDCFNVKEKDEELVKEDGEHLPEHITYDKDSNTLLIETPAGISSNSSAATFAIDFDRVSS